MKQPWTSLALTGLLFGGTAVMPVAASSSENPTPKDDGVRKTLSVGKKVPGDITLTDFDGKSTSFDELRGKVVLLHFWSNLCPAERHANPVFKKMEERYAGSKDVVMLGIASNQNELGAKPGKDADYSQYYVALRKKRDEVGYRHTILADHGNVVSTLFGARSTPHCFVIDKEGVIRYSGALDDDPRGRKGEGATNFVMYAAKAILSGEKLPVTETKPYG